MTTSNAAKTAKLASWRIIVFLCCWINMYKHRRRFTVRMALSLRHHRANIICFPKLYTSHFIWQLHWITACSRLWPCDVINHDQLGHVMTCWLIGAWKSVEQCEHTQITIKSYFIYASAHLCVSDDNWFRCCLVPTHYPNQCCYIVNWNLATILNDILIKLEK